jgi:hypothetical protein
MIVDLEQVCIKVREKARKNPEGITKGRFYLPMLLSDGCLIGQSVLELYGRSYLPFLKKNRFLKFKVLCEKNFKSDFINQNIKYIEWLSCFQENEDLKKTYSVCEFFADQKIRDE